MVSPPSEIFCKPPSKSCQSHTALKSPPHALKRQLKAIIPCLLQAHKLMCGQSRCDTPLAMMSLFSDSVNYWEFFFLPACRCRPVPSNASPHHIQLSGSLCSLWPLSPLRPPQSSFPPPCSASTSSPPHSLFMGLCVRSATEHRAMDFGWLAVWLARSLARSRSLVCYLAERCCREMK